MHFWDGQTEAHFHFFVVVSLLILYQDWEPFLIALCVVVVHHGVLGALVPQAVYDHFSAVAHPWMWAMVHGCFLLAVSAANVVSWRATEQLLRDRSPGWPAGFMLFDRLRLALHRARRRGHHADLIFLDLDRFKLLNDSFGHAVGDRLLVETGSVAPARRRVPAGHGGALLRRRVRGRLRGPRRSRSGDLHRRAADVRAAGAVPHRRARARDDGPSGSRSAAATSAPPRTSSARPDAAMYRAKELGKDTCVVFDDAMRARALARLEHEADLHRAIAGEQPRLQYQPGFALGSGRVQSVEALVRWQHPSRGLVQPDDFIPTAAETGLIAPIGDWVIQESCRQLAHWRRERSIGDLTVRVNVSARQLDDDGLVETIERALRDNSIEPAALCLELTETAVTSDPAHSLAILGQVRDLGVRLALDDFGTGYSSMATCASCTSTRWSTACSSPTSRRTAATRSCARSSRWRTRSTAR